MLDKLALKMIDSRHLQSRKVLFNLSLSCLILAADSLPKDHPILKWMNSNDALLACSWTILNFALTFKKNRPHFHRRSKS